MNFRKENIHLIPKFLRNNCKQIFYKIGVLEHIAQFAGNNFAGVPF